MEEPEDRVDLHQATAYKSFVRFILEYAITIWDPYTQHTLDKIEAIQRRAARYVPRRYHNTFSVEDMLEVLQWPSLQQRCHTARLTMLYKICNKHVSATGPKRRLMPQPPCQ